MPVVPGFFRRSLQTDRVPSKCGLIQLDQEVLLAAVALPATLDVQKAARG